jgi:hypothetical protein
VVLMQTTQKQKQYIQEKEIQARAVTYFLYLVEEVIHHLDQNKVPAAY